MPPPWYWRITILPLTLHPAADKLITERLAQVLGMVDVKVLDHLIVGGSDIYSFAEHGLI